MINLKRLNGKEFILNADLIKYIESAPDTIITLSTNAEKIMVLDTVEDVLNKTIEYKRKCFYWPKEG